MRRSFESIPPPRLPRTAGSARTGRERRQPAGEHLLAVAPDLGPFAIYQPASTSVGMYQMTDPTFAEARRYCIRDHIVVDDGCSWNGLDIRVAPSRAVELASVYLDRHVTQIVAHRRPAATPQQTQELAAIIHLCGADQQGRSRAAVFPRPPASGAATTTLQAISLRSI